MATMSATGLVLADSNRVFKPLMFAAGANPAQAKLNSMSVGSKAEFGVTPIKNDCAAPGAIDTSASRSPLSALVAESVV